MALTLPYPNLDFVPLDVLTAEEMNEIVANYTYIANQFPISSANIATAGVTSNNIDWASMQISSAEKVVGMMPDGTTPIYEKSYSGTVELTANNLARIQVESQNFMPVGGGGYWKTYTDQYGPFNSIWGGGIFSSIGNRIVNGANVMELRFQTTANYTASYNVWVRYIKLSS